MSKQIVPTISLNLSDMYVVVSPNSQKCTIICWHNTNQMTLLSYSETYTACYAITYWMNLKHVIDLDIEVQHVHFVMMKLKEIKP